MAGAVVRMESLTSLVGLASTRAVVPCVEISARSFAIHARRNTAPSVSVITWGSRMLSRLGAPVTLAPVPIKGLWASPLRFF